MHTICFIVTALLFCGVSHCVNLENVVGYERHSEKSVAPTTASVTTSSNKSTTDAGTVTTATVTPKPSHDIWTVKDSRGLYCILMKANITLTLKENNKTRSWMMPKPGTGNSTAHGVCSNDKQSIMITGNNVSVSFNFLRDQQHHNLYYMGNMSVHGHINHHNFSVEVIVNGFWSDNMDLSMMYRCNTTEVLYSSDNVAGVLHLTKLTVSDMQLEAFQNATTPEFSSSVKECFDDSIISNLVPIIVGAALGGLILIVLIAYLIGRKRSRRGYEQV